LQVQRGGEAVHAMKLFRQLNVAELVREQGQGGVVGGPGGGGLMLVGSDGKFSAVLLFNGH